MYIPSSSLANITLTGDRISGYSKITVFPLTITSGKGGYIFDLEISSLANNTHLGCNSFSLMNVDVASRIKNSPLSKEAIAFTSPSSSELTQLEGAGKWILSVEWYNVLKTLILSSNGSKDKSVPLCTNKSTTFNVSSSKYASRVKSPFISFKSLDTVFGTRGSMLLPLFSISIRSPDGLC